MSMRSEFLAFSPPAIDDAEIDAVVETLRTPWITTGPRTKEFEETFAAIGTPSALAVSSCTDAMLIALAALDLGPGDAVFAPTMTFAATINVIEHLGAEAILIDCDPVTLNMDTSPSSPRRAQSSPRAGSGLQQSCQCITRGAPSTWPRSSTWREPIRWPLSRTPHTHFQPPTTVDWSARPSMASHGRRKSPLHATKNLCTAEGGMLTGSDDLLEEAALWRLPHGMSRDAWNRYCKGGTWYYEIVRPGYKCNMTDIQAAMGLVQLTKLDEFQLRRKEVVDAYGAALGSHPAFQVPASNDDRFTSAWHLYPLRLNLESLSINRDRFIEEMTARNIGTSVHFIPIHFHPWFQKRYGFTDSSFPVAVGEFHRNHVATAAPDVSDSDIADVTEAVIEIAEKFTR